MSDLPNEPQLMLPLPQRPTETGAALSAPIREDLQKLLAQLLKEVLLAERRLESGHEQ